jgi:prepilin-type N-terminal cleavage/methylation domain-containing protein
MNNHKAGTPDSVAADVRRLTLPANDRRWPDSSRRLLQPQADALPRTRPVGFTLIEMLVVTAIIGILAALIFPVAGSVRKVRDLKRTRTELMLVATAIEGYKDKLGHYPPDNALSTDLTLRYARNPLCYELRGTSLINQGAAYQCLDGSAQVANTPATFTTLFGPDAAGQPVVAGFINCTRGTGGDEGQPALKFLPELKAGQYVDIMVNGATPCRLLGCSLDGPNAVSDPTTSRKFSPFWYNASSPTNSPNSFDLWVDVQVGSKLYRVSNWSPTPQVF